MDVSAEPWRRLSAEELMLSNCGSGEDSWESLGQQGDQASLSERKSTLNIHWKDWCLSSNNLATWCEDWVWANSGSWWWTGRSGVLRFMGSQRVGHDWSTELNSTDVKTHWKRPWCYERMRAGEERGNRGWDSWMASLTQWTWVWADSGRWWRTGKPGCCSPRGHKELGTT